MMFPLMISATGILTCVLVTLIATDLKPAKQISEIESTLKMQLIISTVLMTPVTLAVALTSLPPTFVLSVPSRDPSKEFASKVRGGSGGLEGGCFICRCGSLCVRRVLGVRAGDCAC